MSDSMLDTIVRLFSASGATLDVEQLLAYLDDDINPAAASAAGDNEGAAEGHSAAHSSGKAPKPDAVLLQLVVPTSPQEAAATGHATCLHPIPIDCSWALASQARRDTTVGAVTSRMTLAKRREEERQRQRRLLRSQLKGGPRPAETTGDGGGDATAVLRYERQPTGPRRALRSASKSTGASVVGRDRSQGPPLPPSSPSLVGSAPTTPSRTSSRKPPSWEYASSDRRGAAPVVGAAGAPVSTPTGSSRAVDGQFPQAAGNAVGRSGPSSTASGPHRLRRMAVANLAARPLLWDDGEGGSSEEEGDEGGGDGVHDYYRAVDMEEGAGSVGDHLSSPLLHHQHAQPFMGTAAVTDSGNALASQQQRLPFYEDTEWLEDDQDPAASSAGASDPQAHHQHSQDATAFGLQAGTKLGLNAPTQRVYLTVMIKRRNQKKHHSHRWFFEAFAAVTRLRSGGRMPYCEC